MKNSNLRTFAFLGMLLISLASAKAQYVPETSPKKDTTIYVPSSAKAKSNERTSSGKGFQKDKLMPGGNLALNFGNPYYIDVSPFLGYRFTDELMLGLGLTYVYSGGTYGTLKYSSSYYGGRVFGRYRVFENVYVNGELEFMNAPPYTYSGTSSYEARKWIVSPMIGASYVIPVGERGGVQISLLYNLNYQQLYSPYPSAVIFRVGAFF